MIHALAEVSTKSKSVYEEAEKEPPTVAAGEDKDSGEEDDVDSTFVSVGDAETLISELSRLPLPTSTRLSSICGCNRARSPSDSPFGSGSA